jgi:predicted nucleotidyltransferase
MSNMLNERQAHLTTREQAALAALVDRLRQRYGDDLLRVVLFGSKARGDFDAESDLDVLVVVRAKDYWSCWREITDLTTQLLLETGVNLSALVRDETRYQWWAVHHAPIYNSIQRDGVKVWTRHSEPSLLSV